MATKDVPAGVTVVGIPAKVVSPRDKTTESPRFVAYGTPTGDIPDPVVRALEGLLDEVQSLRARVNTLESTSSEGHGDETLSVVEGDGASHAAARAKA